MSVAIMVVARLLDVVNKWRGKDNDWLPSVSSLMCVVGTYASDGGRKSDRTQPRASKGVGVRNVYELNFNDWYNSNKYETRSDNASS
jgi:hypothetical protein